MYIILGISSLSSKLGKIRKQIVRMVAIFKMSAKTHQNFKVLQFQRKLILEDFRPEECDSDKCV
jgi:hypothetical protein